MRENVALLLFFFFSVSSFPSSWFAGNVLSDFLILTQALSTAEQVVGKNLSRQRQHFCLICLVSLCNMTVCGAANSNLGPSRNASFVNSKYIRLQILAI